MKDQIIKIAAIWKNFSSSILMFEVFDKRHRIHYIFDNEAENKIKNFGNIGINYRSMNGGYVGIGPKKTR